MDWDLEAQKSMDRVPFFVRRMAKKKVEDLVQSRGRDRVTLQDVIDARNAVGMDARNAAIETRAPEQSNGHAGGKAGEAIAASHSSGSEEQAAPEPTESGELTLSGLSEAQIRRIEELVEKTGGHESRFFSIRGCGGAVGCPLTLVDVAQITERMKTIIEESGLSETLKGRVRGPVLSHHKFKTAVAGCPNSCSDPHIKDFAIVAQAKPGRGAEDCIECLQCVAACKEGAIHVVDAEPIIDESLCARCGDCAAACPTGSLVVEKQGFTILVGGKLGRHPKLAEKLVELVDEEMVYRALSACIELIEEEGQGGERLGVILERVGIDRLREKLANGQKVS